MLTFILFSIFLALEKPVMTRGRNSVFIKVSKDNGDLDNDSILFDCVRMCASSENCFGASVTSAGHKCDHFNSSQMENVNDSDEHLYKKIYPICENGGYGPDGSGTACVCPGSFTGTYCERYWDDCTEGVQLGSGSSGVYTIQPRPYPFSFPVYCDMGWSGRTYIQKQKEGIDFFRNWEDYKHGFGDLEEDHWLGLEKIKAITDSNDYSLLVELHYPCCPSSRRGYYHSFSIADESYGYVMNFTHMSTTPERELWDALKELSGAKFSTYDRDNDDNPNGNCAVTHRSAWWFKNCTSCNPNGRLKPIPVTVTGDPTELFWSGDTRGMTRMFLALVRR